MSDRDATGSGDDFADPESSGDDLADPESPSDDRATPQSGDDGTEGDRQGVRDSTGERDGVDSEWVEQVERVESADRIEEGDGPVVAVDSEDEPGGGDEEPGLMAALFGASGEDAPPTPTIERESPHPENVLFVALGVMLALFVLYQLWTIGAA